jgi:chromosome segregation ATPase
LINIIFLILSYFKKILGDVSINIDLNEFLEDAGILSEIKDFDESISGFKLELDGLETMEIHYETSISKAGSKLEELNEKFLITPSDFDLEKRIKKLKIKIKELKESQNKIEEDINSKNENIQDLIKKKHVIIKKNLLKLHSDMKEDYKKADEDHTRYMELMRKSKENMNVIDRKIMYIKFLVHKNYDLRLL